MVGLAFLLLCLNPVGLGSASAQAESSFSFSLPGSSLAACWFYGVSFTAAEGQQITAQWNENFTDAGPVSVDFYIAPLTAVRQIWLCEDGPVYSYWNDGAYGTARWIAPSTGAYAVVVVNYSWYPVSGTISIMPTNGTLSATSMGPSTVRRIRIICSIQTC